MKVFADSHHDALFHSLRLLFEGRLGYELYRPIGLNWYEKGFWKYSDNPNVIKQYLEPRDIDKDMGDFWNCPESRHCQVDKAVTLEQFKKMKFDIIIPSVVNNEEPFYKLRNEHMPKAKIIRQMGNVHDTVHTDLCPNIMASMLLEEIPGDCNIIQYHQEFDLKTFKYLPPAGQMRISNFMNCFPDCRDFPLWDEFKKELPDFDWKMYGILGENGIIGGIDNVAKEISNSTFIWHVKPGGDGYGHVVHNAFACGRPLIIRRKYYADKLGGLLLEHGKTCIDIDAAPRNEIIDLIKFFAIPENHAKMCKDVRQRFDDVVNFDEQAKYIKEFLKELI